MAFRNHNSEFKRMDSLPKKYLLHLRDIFKILPYLSPKLTLKLMFHWLTSLRFNLDNALYVYNMKKHRVILDYLESRYSHLLPTSLTYDVNATDAAEPLPIWVMWYQGIDNMPPLVKLCVESIKQNACGRLVYLLDKHNLSQYIKLPDYIYEKKEKGIITMACFSDIVRLSLLGQYGGTWLDATVYVNKPLTENGLNPYFNSIKMPVMQRGHISDYRWAGFCLYARPGASTMCCFRNIMLAYFKDGHKRIIDYLLIDYTFQMLYEKCDDFKTLIDGMPRENEYTYELVKVLNEPFSEEFMTRCGKQQFFKLNWRIKLKEGNTMFHGLERMMYKDNSQN